MESDIRESAAVLEPAAISPEFVQRIPIAFARRFGVLGLNADNGTLPVANASLDALSAVDKIAVLLGTAVELVMTDGATLHRAIHEAYGLHHGGVEGVIEDLPEAEAASLVETLSGSGDLLDTAGNAPVTKLVNVLLFEAVKRRASDVHIQPFEDHLQVRLRIDGVLYDFVKPPQHLKEEIISRIKVMGRMNVAEKRLAQDGRTTVRVGERIIDLRISTLPTCFGERVVLRLLDKSARLYGLAELGMRQRDLEAFRGLIRRAHGIILVTGPTGSGKSTTLYAALQEIKFGELNVVTLEDPIEYQLSGISQTQVAERKGMTFATGLRHVLRQDPDVIMVGEIRDQETARMAIQSSLTGHLVLSTLHTNDAAGAVARLLDLGVEPYLVAGSLLGVLAQRLVRRLCEDCRVAHTLSEADVALLQLDKKYEGARVFTASRCATCHETGYRDRVGIFEFLKVNEALQELINSHPKSQTLKRLARRSGMTTLREDVVRKLLDGTTTVEEVLRVTADDELSNE